MEAKEETKSVDTSKNINTEEEDQFIAKEREELKVKLEEHKKKVMNMIIGCISTEIMLASIFVKSSAAISIANIFNIYHDTLDCTVSIILRLIALYILTTTAIKLGNPKLYENDCKYIGIKARVMRIILLVWKYIFNHSKSKIHDAYEGNEATLFKENKSTRKKVYSTFNLDELINKYNQIDPVDLADFWKNTVWLILFAFISIFQAYIGIKTVFFVTRNYYLHLLFGFNIFLCHFEMYWIQKYINDCTEPDNKFFDTNIHSHAMFLRAVPGNWCDLCWQRIDKMCYRCNNCDYDVCAKCWKKEKKAKKLAEQKNNKKCGDVTVYEYFKRLFELYINHWIALAVALIIVCLTSLISIILPASRGELFDYIFEVNLDNFYGGLKMYIILTVSQGLLNAVHNILKQRVEEQIMNEVQQSLYERILKQDMAYFDSSTASVLVDRLGYGLNDALSPFLSLTSDGIRNIISLIGSFYFCWQYSFRLLLLAFSTLGPMAYLSILFRKWYSSSMRAVWYFDSDLYRFASESFKNIRTIRSYSKEPSMKTHYNNVRNEVHNRKMKGALLNALNNTVISWFNLASSTLIIWAGGILVFQQLQRQKNNDVDLSMQLSATDLLTLGELITFERYWNKLKHSIFSFQRQIQKFDKACFMAKHIFRLLDSNPNIEYIENTIEENKNNKNKINDIDGDIVFNNVHYTYIIEPNKKVLKGINLTIPKGKTTAFVGRSGGGKTTLINLILRFYDPTQGNITINGIDIKDIDVYSLRNQIALVSQNTELFAKSIAHNIAFGVDNYRMEDIHKCAKLANAHDFINKFDEGYNCKIGDNGTKLSGGQKQRISIARMLIKKPKLMLLDEATSSLDAESEALVQAALDLAIKDEQSTVVLVAHRLSTVVNSDQIIVIDDGKVIESGNHLQLIQRNGLYAKLVDRQLNLKHKMKEKANNIKIKNGNENKDELTMDTDNIDELIQQIRKDNEITIGNKT